MLDQIAQRASQQVDQLCQRWRINREIGSDVVKLGLYDIILYIGMFCFDLRVYPTFLLFSGYSVAEEKATDTTTQMILAPWPLKKMAAVSTT